MEARKHNQQKEPTSRCSKQKAKRGQKRGQVSDVELNWCSFCFRGVFYFIYTYSVVYRIRGDLYIYAPISCISFGLTSHPYPISTANVGTPSTFISRVLIDRPRASFTCQFPLWGQHRKFKGSDSISSQAQLLWICAPVCLSMYTEYISLSLPSTLDFGVLFLSHFFISLCIYLSAI